MSEDLDRRASAAVRALDHALGDDVEVPPFVPPAPRRRSRVAPLLVAAAVIVVALVGLTVSRLDGGDDQSTVAGETDPRTTDEGFVRLALPQPSEIGYRVSAAYDGTNAVPASYLESTVQAPDGDQSWEETVVVSVYSGDSFLYGELIDIGGRDAAVGAGFPGNSLTWIDGDRHISLHSARRSEDDLTRLARVAVEAGWQGDGPLPGHRVLYEPGEGDTYGVLAFVSPDSPLALAAVGYLSGPGGVDFAVATAPGGDDLYRTLQIFARDIEPVEVRGREGVLVRRDGNDDLAEIIWRENDATVARVETFAEPDDIIELLEALAATDAVDFAAIVAEHPVDDEDRVLSYPDSSSIDRGDPFTDRPDVVLGEIDATTDGIEVQAMAHETEDGATELALLLTEPSGAGSGTGLTTNGLERVIVGRLASSGAPTVFGGFAPGSIESVMVEIDGTRFPTTLRTQAMAGSSASMFLAWTDSPRIDNARTQIVHVTLADGRVLRFAT